MVRNISIILIVSLISACSSSEAGYAEKSAEKSAENDKEYAKLAKDENMVCEFIAQVGSHRKKRTCMTKALSEEIRKRNQDAMRKTQKGGRTQAHTK